MAAYFPEVQYGCDYDVPPFTPHIISCEDKRYNISQNHDFKEAFEVMITSLFLLDSMNPAGSLVQEIGTVHLNLCLFFYLAFILLHLSVSCLIGTSYVYWMEYSSEHLQHD